MDSSKYSLRVLIKKWLPDGAISIRIVRDGSSLGGVRRCVRVDVQRPGGLLSFLFFRHDDNLWYVFPPKTARPCVSWYLPCYVSTPMMEKSDV